MPTTSTRSDQPHDRPPSPKIAALCAVQGEHDLVRTVLRLERLGLIKKRGADELLDAIAKHDAAVLLLVEQLRHPAEVGYPSAN